MRLCVFYLGKLRAGADVKAAHELVEFAMGNATYEPEFDTLTYYAHLYGDPGIVAGPFGRTMDDMACDAIDNAGRWLREAQDDGA